MGLMDAKKVKVGKKKQSPGHADLLLKRAAIRRDEVKRHTDSQALIMHRRAIDQGEKLATMRMERDQILGARAQAGHLPQHLTLRLSDLQSVIPKRKKLL